jgi:acyl dehydratase
LHSKYFDDFVLNEKYIMPSRTVTETDVMLFAGLTGDYNLLHTDEEFAKQTIFKTRLAHGLLGLSLGMGLFQRMGFMQRTGIAYLGIESWKFTGPIRLGDTIRSEVTVVEKKETSKPDRGIVKLDMVIFNQNGEVVQKGTHSIMVAKK